MDRIVVRPSGPLQGSVRIGGAKNSALKLLAATLLCEGDHVLHGVPHILDVDTMGDLLVSMGCAVTRRTSDDAVVVHRPAEVNPEAPYELVERMRASIVVLGPLLAAEGRARISLPGGDDLGSRPIDLHLAGLQALGAELTSSHGYIEARAELLIGTRIVLEFPSVGATENIVMAAVRAKGTTVVENAAREPEIADLSDFLSRMGARIVGAGTSTVEIEGVEDLHAVEHTVVPDRIEAATFLAAVGLAGGNVMVEGARADHMDMLIQKLGDMGMSISPTGDGLWAARTGRLRSIDVSTLPYPGVATDYKPLLVAMLCVADGVGIVTENLYDARFRYVAELVRMGADIRTESHHAVVRGVERLSGARVRAPDIRAGAALVVAGLAADGVTVVEGTDHIDRGYENLVGKLAGLGADVAREAIPSE